MTLTACLLAALAVLAVITYIIGLFDRPRIQEGILLQGVDEVEPGGDDGEIDHVEQSTKSKPNVFVVMAISRKKRNRKLEATLTRATKEAINIAWSDDQSVFEQGTEAYLGKSESNPDSISASFMYERTAPVQDVQDAPRWAIGWILRDDSVEFDALQQSLQEDKLLSQIGLKLDENKKKSLKEKLKAMITQFKKESQGLGEELRVVRLHGKAKILKGSFPWRTFLTPAIAGFIQWTRSLKEYNTGQNNQQEAANVRPVAMEVYIRRKKFCTSQVDYNLVLGDTRDIWQDAFPGFVDFQTALLAEKEVNEKDEDAQESPVENV